MPNDQKIRWGGTFPIELFLWIVPWLCGFCLFTLFSMGRSLAKLGFHFPSKLMPVLLEGWYRRGVRPYVEMSKIIAPDGRAHRTYSRWIQFMLAIAAVAVGSIWFLS